MTNVKTSNVKKPARVNAIGVDMEQDICIAAVQKWIGENNARWVVLENRIYFFNKEIKSWETWTFSELINYVQAFHLNLHTMKHLTIEIVKTAFQELEAYSARTNNGMGVTDKNYLFLEKTHNFIVPVQFSEKGAAIAVLKAAEFLQWSLLWDDILEVFFTASQNVGIKLTAKTPILATRLLKSVFHQVDFKSRLDENRVWCPVGWRNLPQKKLMQAITYKDDKPKKIKWNLSSTEKAILINAVTESLLAAKQL